MEVTPATRPALEVADVFREARTGVPGRARATPIDGGRAEHCTSWHYAAPRPWVATPRRASAAASLTHQLQFLSQSALSQVPGGDSAPSGCGAEAGWLLPVE